MSTVDEQPIPAQTTALQPAEVARLADNPNQLVALAIVNGTPPETLSKLFDLQERWEKSAARKAYVQAMSDFKAEAPAFVPKASAVDFSTQKGRTHYRYANLGDVCNAVTHLLAKHQLHTSWETSQGDGITVTCHVTHSAGHRESVTLSAGPDESGNKNKIQAVGSTVTYLQRYTMLAALGLATADQDDDGRGAGQPIDNATPRTANGATIDDLTGKKADAASKTAELAKQVQQQDPQGQHGTGAVGPATKKPAKTWEEILAYTLGKIAEARAKEDANEGQAALTKIKAALPNYKFPHALQQQVDRAVADATHAFEVGDAFDASNAPPDGLTGDIYLPALANLLNDCTTIPRLDEITERWKEDKENVSAEVYNRGLELIGLAQPRMIP